MGRKIQDSDTKESWYGIEDPKERKRIQDRLAQRARRKKKATLNMARKEAKTGLDFQRNTLSKKNTLSNHDGPPNFIYSAQELSAVLLPRVHDTAYRLYEEQCDIAMNDPAIWSIVQQFTPSPYSSQSIHDPRKSAWRAFDENGRRMGIRSICVGLVCSWRQSSDLPATLQPSPLQLTVPHPVWLDRLPFPRLRDNFILLIETINMEEFYVDLFIKESFHVDQNKESHDISAYYILPDFRDKWGYLCY